MSSTFRSDNGYNVDVEELLQIGIMCEERLESNATAASEARLRDKRYTEELERELRNCFQEIGYLQDQLNLRNVESNCMGEHVHSLELKLAEVGTLHEKLRLLSEELVQSDYKQLILMRETKDKEEELQNSALQIEELETAVSSIALESQCEIESMRLDITSLEERCFEAERFIEQATQEKAKMDVLLEESESQLQEAQERISCLEMENKELKQKLVASETKAKGSHCKVAERLDNWLKHNSRMSVYVPGASVQDLLVELMQKQPLLKEICTCEEVFCPFVSKPAVVTASDDNIKEEMEKMSNQIREFELLVAQLKEELRIEKVKAKEEAEDLTQAMAELRYQITDMLEEECKRRACIEQASLRRIQDLEEQVRKEQKKSLTAIRRFQEVHKQAEMRSMEVRHLKNALEGFRRITDPETAQKIEFCCCGNCMISENFFDCSVEAPLDAEAENDICKGNTSHQASIGWYRDDEASSAEGGT